MPYTLNAKAIHIEHGSFTDVGGDYIQNNIYSGLDGLQILYKHVAVGAMDDSEERFDAPRCHPETREAVQADIMSWIERSDAGKGFTKMLWMEGPAGSGKTAIQQTIAERCRAARILAASFFFFHGSSERNCKTRFITTIAYQIAQHIIDVRGFVASAVEKDVSIFEKNLEVQMSTLILGPVSRALARGPSCPWPKVILIDGLDECKGEEHQTDVLRVLYGATHSGRLPFRVAIASRPETAIRNAFKSDLQDITHVITLDDKYEPDVDIALFLRSKFTEIGRRHYMKDSASLNWPHRDEIDALVENASGQFIYATTVIKFIGDRSSYPVDQLRIVLASSCPPIHETNPLAPLDVLYTTILRTSLKLTEALHLLHLINELDHCRFSASDIDRFLQLQPGDVERTLESLRSLIYIPESSDSDERSFYRFYHKSLIDFLKDETRSGDLYVSVSIIRTRMVIQYLRTFRNPGRPLSETDEATQNWYRLASPINLLRICKTAISQKELWTELTDYDVEWWANEMYSRGFAFQFSEMFGWIHVKCRWLECTRACTKWRDVIIARSETADWPVPGKKTRFMDKLRLDKSKHERWQAYFGGYRETLSIHPGIFVINKNFQ